MTLIQKTFLFLIRVYQASGFLLRPRCRFWPNCSEYTHEAIETYGPIKGGLMGIGRILRCRPFGKSGFDPVPTRKLK